MLFAQITNRESLRDIEVCLRAMHDKLYRLGLRGKVSRNTLAYANEKRPSLIYSDFCKILMKRAQVLYKDDKILADLDSLAFAIDSTWIKLCLSVCPWAHFGNHSQGFIKIQTVLDLKGKIPSFVAISPAKKNDFESLDYIPIIPGAFYVMDKGYFDLLRLRNIKEAGGFFIIRKKKFVKVYRTEIFSPPNLDLGIISDLIVKFRGRGAKRNYPDRIRLVRFRDFTLNRTFIFLTNNTQQPAHIICQLYKERWNIELFFRWIKQHLRVSTFYGTSSNAIETQIWIAACTYLLVAIAKKELAIKTPLCQLLQFLSVSLFEEIHILQAFSPHPSPFTECDHSNQLILL
jgi:IS4 transposase